MESSHAAFFSLSATICYFLPPFGYRFLFADATFSFAAEIYNSRLLCVSRRQGSKEIQLGVRLVYVEKFTVNFPFFRKTISNRLIAVAGCPMLLIEQKSDRDRFSGSMAFLVSI